MREIAALRDAETKETLDREYEAARELSQAQGIPLSRSLFEARNHGSIFTPQQAVAAHIKRMKKSRSVRLGFAPPPPPRRNTRLLRRQMAYHINQAAAAEFKFYPHDPHAPAPAEIKLVPYEHAQEYNQALPKTNYFAPEDPKATILSESQKKKLKVIRQFKRRYYVRNFRHARPGLNQIPRFQSYCIKKGNMAAARLTKRQLNAYMREWDLQDSNSDIELPTKPVHLFHVGPPNSDQYHPFVYMHPFEIAKIKSTSSPEHWAQISDTTGWKVREGGHILPFDYLSFEKIIELKQKRKNSPWIQQAQQDYADGIFHHKLDQLALQQQLYGDDQIDRFLEWEKRNFQFFEDLFPHPFFCAGKRISALIRCWELNEESARCIAEENREGFRKFREEYEKKRLEDEERAKKMDEEWQEILRNNPRE